MQTYIVKTNRLGRKNEDWKNQVGYRPEDISQAWKSGKDLECFCGEREPERMIIPNAEIYTRIAHIEPLYSPKYGNYKLVYYRWLPTHISGNPIDDKPQQREPLPNQKALF